MAPKAVPSLRITGRGEIGLFEAVNARRYEILPGTCKVDLPLTGFYIIDQRWMISFHLYAVLARQDETRVAGMHCVGMVFNFLLLLSLNQLDYLHVDCSAQNTEDICIAFMMDVKVAFRNTLSGKMMRDRKASAGSMRCIASIDPTLWKKEDLAMIACCGRVNSPRFSQNGAKNTCARMNYGMVIRVTLKVYSRVRDMW